MTDMLQLTRIVQNPNINPSALCSSCTNIACCSSELIFTFLYAGSSIQNAIVQFLLCIHLYFVNFALHPTPQTKIERSYIWSEEGRKEEQRAPYSNSSVLVTIQN